MDLSHLNKKNKEILAKKFIEEVILPQWKQLGSWNKLTSQTSQLDFGYLSQHLVSILSGIEGNNQRGKGDDLKDGSEVKSASCSPLQFSCNLTRMKPAIGYYSYTNR